MAKLKFSLALFVLMVWGPYLLYIWASPAMVPGWAMQSGFRRVLMLSRDFEPTVFTLLFGLGFIGIALFGVIGLITGKARFYK